jgi:hypothetical protein
VAGSIPEGRLNAAQARLLTRLPLKDAQLGAAYKVTASRDGLHFAGVVSSVGSARLSWPDIVALEVQDASRYTATRLMSLGLAGGFAFKKQRAILAIGARSIGSLAMMFPNHSQSELTVLVRTWEAKRPPSPAPEGSAPSGTNAGRGIRDRLRDLESLKKDGLVTESEYEVRREQILDDL